MGEGGAFCHHLATAHKDPEEHEVLKLPIDDQVIHLRCAFTEHRDTKQPAQWCFNKVVCSARGCVSEPSIIGTEHNSQSL